jgi:hypothetical protein
MTSTIAELISAFPFGEASTEERQEWWHVLERERDYVTAVKQYVDDMLGRPRDMFNRLTSLEQECTSLEQRTKELFSRHENASQFCTNVHTIFASRRSDLRQLRATLALGFAESFIDHMMLCKQNKS